MRGVKNLYKAVPVVLFGQIVRHDLLVNNVQVGHVYQDKRGMDIQHQPGTVRLNKKLVAQAIQAS